ncbi:MAG: efflux RND transporter periplasmic adaptor subunit [Anaerolineae bacterium]|nr:efflux RND transporter periplasmic adaptor subunit [Anaerolineae bacterium]MDW8102395.1 efflux RND transporter periplasmic adaptor subunit [Anaerolineae bacterium]
MRLKRMIVGFVLLVLAGGLIYWFAFRPRSTDRAAVEAVPVRRGNLLITVSAVGSVKARAQVSLAFQTSGRVAEVLVSEGDFVEEGQPLARLDTRTLELQVAQAEVNLAIARAQLDKLLKGKSRAQIEAAKAALRSAQAAYEAAKIDAANREKQIRLAEISVEKARIALEQAQAQYDKIGWRPEAASLPQAQQLYQATLDYEAARLNYELTVSRYTDVALYNAAAQLAQARAQLEELENYPSEEDLIIARAQVRQAEIALEQARFNLENATLIAPFNGIVADVNIVVGGTAGPGTPAITLADISSLEIETQLVELDVGKIQEGQEVEIAFDAIPDRTYRGKVAKVGKVGQTVQGVVNYPVTILMEDPDERVKVGMTANLNILVGRVENALLIPIRAVRSSQGRQVVMVKRGETFTPVPVKIGMANETMAEVVEGDIKEGDLVLVSLPQPVMRPPGPFMFGGGAFRGR